MDFDLPADVEQLRRTVRKFVDEAVLAVEHAIDRDNIVPDSILREAARLGLFGITIPEEYMCPQGCGGKCCPRARLVSRCPPFHAGTMFLPSPHGRGNSEDAWAQRFDSAAFVGRLFGLRAFPARSRILL